MLVASAPVVWSRGRRIAFRFAFLFAALFVFPFPLDMAPRLRWLFQDSKLTWLATLLCKPMDWGVNALGGLLDQPVPLEPTEVGDTLYFHLFTLEALILAAIGTVAWSIADRRRLAYPRLAEALTILVRYFVAATMLYYGFAKLTVAQFPFPDAIDLETKIGEASPMRLMWAFMGYSPPYSIFGGAAEVLGAVLLLWRRTATLGALVVMAVMTNVLMLNLCYDVSVKLFSSLLLIASLALLAPDARRLLAAGLGYATAPAPERPRWSARGERARRLIKIALLLMFAYQRYLQTAVQDEWLAENTPEVAGIWIVEQQQPEPRPGARWQRIAFSPFAMAVRDADGARQQYGASFDRAARAVKVRGARKGAPARWTYRWLDPDRLEIDAEWAGAPLHLTLRREPPGALETHRARWILM